MKSSFHSARTQSIKQAFVCNFFYLAFVVDQGDHVFVWIGSRASEDEKKNALPMAHVSCQYRKYFARHL